MGRARVRALLGDVPSNRFANQVVVVVVCGGGGGIATRLTDSFSSLLSPLGSESFEYDVTVAASHRSVMSRAF